MGRKGTVMRLQVRRRPKISGHDVYVEARDGTSDGKQSRSRIIAIEHSRARGFQTFSLPRARPRLTPFLFIKIESEIAQNFLQARHPPDLGHD